MRLLAKDAEVPLALLSYHFGTKEDLYKAVLRSRIDPINQARRSKLARIRSTKKPDARAIFEALARPWIDLHKSPDGRFYTQLIAREVTDPQEGVRGILKELLDPTAKEFIQVIADCHEEPPPLNAALVYHFFIGALMLIMASSDRVKRLSDHLVNPEDGEILIENIVAFFSRALASSGDRK